MSYVLLNPVQEALSPAMATKPTTTLGAATASGPLASMASALGTSESSLLLLLGGGMLFGYAMNTLVTGTEKKIKKRRSLAKRRRDYLAAAPGSPGISGATVAKLLVGGMVFGGVVWFFASHMSIAKAGE